jgi:single-stranded-DNA-specific exonuclease RecJ
MSASNQISEGVLWVYPKKDDILKEQIVREFKINPITAQILVSRGFDDLSEVHDYLYAKLPDLHDPFLLNGMPLAAKRVLKALETGEGILIYGDNDVDGMTGTALLVEFLQMIGCKVHFLVSARGISRDLIIVEAIEQAKKLNCTLMITVDCGISAVEEIAKVAEAGIDVIVTDHHEPTDKIPHCVATLNPKLLGSDYPNREMTGVGVAFKLAHGITTLFANDPTKKKVDLKRLLDLVALGTVADMGVLLGENRILVRYGLEQLRKTRRVGLVKLIQVCELEIADLTASDIVFKIAPRLNSLGRIDDPQKGVELLLLRNTQEAEKMANELNLNNTERQKIERTMSIEVEGMMTDSDTFLKERALILTSKNWHPGVIAIISTRLSKQYNRPAILIAIDGDLGKGSLRSIPQFPLISHLKECKDLLKNFGGHDLAAGLTIEVKNIPEFRRRFLLMANNILKPEDVMNKLYLDAEVAFEDLTFEFLESNKLLEPFGNGNFPPVFYAKANQAWPPKIIGKTHLKIFLEQNDRILEGIALNRAKDRHLIKDRKEPLEIAFSPQLNLFQKDSIQLLIKDFK